MYQKMTKQLKQQIFDECIAEPEQIEIRAFWDNPNISVHDMFNRFNLKKTNKNLEELCSILNAAAEYTKKDYIWTISNEY